MSCAPLAQTRQVLLAIEGDDITRKMFAGAGDARARVVTFQTVAAKCCISRLSLLVTSLATSDILQRAVIKSINR